jgi:hypothetical protein
MNQEVIHNMSESMSASKIILLILYAVAMAMGVAVIVLPLLGQAVDFTMVGIAIFCLALAGLNTTSD